MSEPAYVLTPSAERDLRAIWFYIAADNINAADKLMDRVEQAFETLSQLPGTGHYRTDLSDRRHRFHSIDSYMIVYRWETKPLQIIRVLHAARDIQSLLETEH